MRIGVVFFTLISLALIGLGVYMMKEYPDVYDGEVTAVVTEAHCDGKECLLKVAYQIGDKKHEKNIKTKEQSKVGAKIDIQYMKNDPEDIRAKKPSMVDAGKKAIGVGVGMFVLTMVYYFITSRMESDD